MRTLPYSSDSVWEEVNIWAWGTHLCGLIWWAQPSPTQLSKPSTIISKSLHRVEELSNHNDLTINLTFKIPSEWVWSALIYFISQTIRSVLKPWLTRSHFLMPYVSKVPWSNVKTRAESHTLLKSKGGWLSMELGFHPEKPTNSVWVLPLSEDMWILLWCPSYHYVKHILQAAMMSSWH